MSAKILVFPSREPFKIQLKTNLAEAAQVVAQNPKTEPFEQKVSIGIFSGVLTTPQKISASTFRLLEWFLNFALSGRLLRYENTNFFYLNYKYAATDTGYSIHTIEKLVKKLTVSGLCFKKTITTQKGRRAFVAFNKETIYPLLKESYKNKLKEKLEKIMLLENLIEAPIRNFQPDCKIITEPVIRIFEKLREIKIDPGNTNSKHIFRHKFPHEYGGKWTKTLKDSADYLHQLHEGRIRFSDWAPEEFLKGHASNRNLITEETKNKVKAAKGNWKAVEALVLEAAHNFCLWFDERYEPQGKRWLHDLNVKTWLFDPQNIGGSVFLACVLKPPFSIKETFTDNIYNSIPEAVADIAEGFKISGWDNFRYWTAVKSVVKWYEDNAAEIVDQDSNARYWFDGGLSRWFTRYVEYLDRFGGIVQHQVGVGNNTWRAFVADAMKFHRIKIDLTEIN